MTSVCEAVIPRKFGVVTNLLTDKYVFVVRNVATQAAILQV